jgi:UDP-glucose 4-epimerase
LFEEVKFDGVFHLAANSDIAAGSSDSRLDLELNLLTTISILEAMRDHGVKRLFLASSSAVFGESDVPLGEDHGPMRPISFYGASKLAAEAYVSAFTHAYDMRSIIMRFPNVVGGSRTTHGVVHDLFRRLGADGLLVHGDGSQLKPYLHVDDLLDAIMLSVLCWDKAPFSVYHAAAGSGRTSVRKVAEIVADGAPVFFDGKTWAGDVRRYSYADCDRLRALGWRPTLTSTDAVQVAVDEMRLKCAS